MDNTPLIDDVQSLIKAATARIGKLQTENKALAEALRELRDAVCKEDKLATVTALFKAEAALRGAGMERQRLCPFLKF